MGNVKQEVKWYCVGHFLNCLYQDFINHRIAGEQLPCLTCGMVNECNEQGGAPVENLQVISNKTGININVFRER